MRVDQTLPLSYAISTVRHTDRYYEKTIEMARSGGPCKLLFYLHREPLLWVYGVTCNTAQPNRDSHLGNQW